MKYNLIFIINITINATANNKLNATASYITKCCSKL